VPLDRDVDACLLGEFTTRRTAIADRTVARSRARELAQAPFALEALDELVGKISRYRRKRPARLAVPR